VRLFLVTGRCGWLFCSDLDSGIVRDHFRNACRQQEQSSAVIAIAQLGNRLAPEATDFSIRQYRLESVAHFDAIFAILHGEQDQNAAVCRLAADSPLLKQVYGVTLNVGAIERIHRNHSNLRVRLLVDLPTDAVDSGNRVLVYGVSEVVNVISGMQLRHGFGLRAAHERECSNDQTEFDTPLHRGKLYKSDNRSLCNSTESSTVKFGVERGSVVRAREKSRRSFRTAGGIRQPDARPSARRNRWARQGRNNVRRLLFRRK